AHTVRYRQSWAELPGVLHVSAPVQRAVMNAGWICAAAERRIGIRIRSRFGREVSGDITELVLNESQVALQVKDLRHVRADFERVRAAHVRDVVIPVRNLFREAIASRVCSAENGNAGNHDSWPRSGLRAWEVRV